MQKFFNFLVKHNAYLLLLLYCSVALLVIRFEQDDLLSKIRSGGTELQASISDKITSYGYLFNLRKENERLMKINAELLSNVLRDQTVLHDEKNRRALFADSAAASSGYITARVIDRKFSSRENMLLIDAGKKRGIRRDMTVLTPQGLVGRVIFVSDNYAKVMPVIHSDFKVSVSSDRSNALGILSWNGGAEHLAAIEHVPISSPLKKGEMMLTTDFSTFSPRSIPVGRVIRIKPDKLFYSIDIRLAVDFSSLTYVLVAPLKTDPEKIEAFHEDLPQEQPGITNPVN
ncbi:rod shape-determining protein MreC [Chlorobium limicola]|uniref:Cell shape-determining protein MreC n=1 Tax=Chlorobium limicola TaxID=1092 RepID=A0A124GAN5_CHLLI|nr:rod shape-determining protein MreC [Chlorobium limicola]KUL32797.1 rod shape-determining protein MreC [Chlorobium limicola]